MLLTLDGTGPRYAQITRALRGMIQAGVLPFDARLPPTRELARDLGCSRNIVLLAYEQLVLEGYLVSRQGAGTFVSPAWPRVGGAAGPAPAGRAGPPVRLSQRGRLGIEAAEHARAVMTRRKGLTVDFMYGLCEPDPRVVARLRAAFNSGLRSRAFRYGPPAGDPDAAAGTGRPDPRLARHHQCARSDRGDQRHAAGPRHLRPPPARSGRSHRGRGPGLFHRACGLHRGRRHPGSRAGRRARARPVGVAASTANRCGRST